MNGFTGVIGEFSAEYVVNRSRFIGTAKGVLGEEQARAFVGEMRKKYSLATHNCYAYVADENGTVRKFADDGEPQGTAGMPILEVITAKNFRRTAVVVTRFFGGVKLGAGGLVRAYAKAAADALDGAKTAEFVKAVSYKLSFDYERYAKFGKFNERFTAAVSDVKFGNSVTLTVAVPEENAADYTAALRDLYGGKIEPEQGKCEYYPFEVK